MIKQVKKRHLNFVATGIAQEICFLMLGNVMKQNPGGPSFAHRDGKSQTQFNQSCDAN